MSLHKFGQYLGDIPDLTINVNLGLDGFDGFDDQSLYDYKKGDVLTFVINPNIQKPILDHKIIQAEILEDTERNDYADTKIISIETVDNFFHSKPITLDNDFLELIDYYNFIWQKTYESKQLHPHIEYKKFENEFLSFSELEKVIINKSYSTIRQPDENTRIYAEVLLDNKTIRVMTIGYNVPDTCFLYDISDVDKYKNTLIEKCSNERTWIDEKNWWAETTK